MVGNGMKGILEFFLSDKRILSANFMVWKHFLDVTVQ